MKLQTGCGETYNWLLFSKSLSVKWFWKDHFKDQKRSLFVWNNTLCFFQKQDVGHNAAENETAGVDLTCCRDHGEQQRIRG